MPTIDTSSIDGFDTMTPEEKVAALLEMDVPERVDMSLFVAKETADKYATEAANLKKQLKSKMSEDEQREADRLAAEEAMKTELENLRRERTLSNYKASYLSLGYDEQLAGEAATALADGDMDTVFANQKKHIVNMEKELRAKILQETPTPAAGSSFDEEAKKKKEMDELRLNFGLPPLK